jgi:hypothetical protein
MSIEDLIRTWKADEDEQDSDLVANPVGEELTDEELREAAGGKPCPVGGTCWLVTCFEHFTG